MTAHTLTSGYGPFALTGESVDLAIGHALDFGYGSFTLTGEPAGASYLWLPNISDVVRLSDPHILTLPLNVPDGLTFGSTATFLSTHGPAVDEAIGLTTSASSALVWAQTASDRVSITEALRLSLGASCSETLTLSQVTSLALAITVAQTLFLSDPVSTTLNFNLSVAEALLANTAFGNFLGASLGEGVLLSGAASPLWQFGASAEEGVTLSDVAGGSLLINITSTDDLTFDDAEVLQYIFSPAIAEGVSITAGYVSPNGNFTAWAVNTRTSAITEYQNFVFDSFAQSGLKFLAGNATGLYELDGDTDAGDPIIADILSGFMDVGGSKFTAYKAAYLGVRSKGGQFVLKLITGDGNTYIYSVTAKDMRSTRVNMGKGLRSRYFRFELINADGADFDLHSIEFLPLVSTRRI
jgi:hypothetical protein